MRSDTMSMLNEFTGEQLLWLAVRSNANMRAKVTRVIESRARRGLVAGLSSNRTEPARSRFASRLEPATSTLRNAI